MKAKLLHVDLTTRQTRSEEVSETVLRKHLGGGALAAHILLRDLPSGVDPPLNALELQPLIDYVNAVTGWNMSLFELMKVGERANTLARLFNDREGFTPADDVLPQRLHEGIGNGAIKGARIDLDEFLSARKTYYEMAGWDPQTGKPTDAKLAELGIT